MNNKKCLITKELGLADNLTQAAKKARKDYYKSWRDNNKDKIKDYNSKYWKKRAERIKNSSIKNNATK